MEDPKIGKLREDLLAHEEEIREPCDPRQYRALLRVCSSEDNHLAVGFGGGSLPGLAGNTALFAILDELGIRPYVKEIWGTSAGSIAGAAWAGGTAAEDVLKILDGLNRKGSIDFSKWEVLVKGVFRFIFKHRLPEGLIRGRSLYEAIEKGLKVDTFEACPIPFRAITCTDDGYARKVIQRKGSLIYAIAASMCIPGVFYPVEDPSGEPYGYLDGGVVEKTPLLSIIEDHARQARATQLVIICTHFSHLARIKPPEGFLERFCHSIEQLEEVVWDHQFKKTQDAPNCKAIVLDPKIRVGGMLNFEYIRLNYLWSRRAFKAQLSNAGLASRFSAR